MGEPVVTCEENEKVLNDFHGGALVCIIMRLIQYHVIVWLMKRMKKCSVIFMVEQSISSLRFLKIVLKWLINAIFVNFSHGKMMHAHKGISSLRFLNIVLKWLINAIFVNLSQEKCVFILLIFFMIHSPRWSPLTIRIKLLVLSFLFLNTN